MSHYGIMNYGIIEVGLLCLCQLTLRTKLWSDWLQRLSLHRRQSPASKLWMKLSLSFVSLLDIECENLFRSSIQSLTVTFASSSPVRSKNVSLRVPFSSLKQFLSRTWKWVLHTCQVKGGSSWSGVTCAWPRAARARRGTSTIIICVPLGPLCPTGCHQGCRQVELPLLQDQLSVTHRSTMATWQLATCCMMAATTFSCWTIQDS